MPFCSSARSVAGGGVGLRAAISARWAGVIGSSAAASDGSNCSTLRAPIIGAVMAGMGHDPRDGQGRRMRLVLLRIGREVLGHFIVERIAIARLIHGVAGQAPLLRALVFADICH